MKTGTAVQIRAQGERLLCAVCLTGPADAALAIPVMPGCEDGLEQGQEPTTRETAGSFRLLARHEPADSCQAKTAENMLSADQKARAASHVVHGRPDVCTASRHAQASAPGPGTRTRATPPCLIRAKTDGCAVLLPLPVSQSIAGTAHGSCNHTDSVLSAEPFVRPDCQL